MTSLNRYSKIKVYKDSILQNIARIRAYQDGAWTDFGEADSDNTRGLYVYDNGIRKRVTLNKSTIQVPGYKYVDSMFTAEPYNGYCYCPRYVNTKTGALLGAYTFTFTANFKRATPGSKNLFKSYSWTSSFPDGGIWITLNADGTITVKIGSNHASPVYKSATSTAKINEDEWNHIKVKANKVTSGDEKPVINVWLNDELILSMTNAVQTWLYYCNNEVGQSGLYIREDGFLISSVDGNQKSRSDQTVPVNKDETTTETVWS